MINNWFFSNNGEVIGPFRLSAAKLYVTENPSAYGWHPTFIQWKPVTCIDEFSRELPPAVQATAIPQEISDQFIAKQKRLENRLSTIDSGIKKTELSIENLDEKISQYKLLTQDLSMDVKGAVNNIENKYTHLKQQLSQIKETVNIANHEMLAVVDDFDRRINANAVSMPSTHHNASQKQNESTKTTFDNTAEKSTLSEEKAEEKLLAAYQTIKTDSQEELESRYLASRHLESKYNVSDYLKLSKKINSPKNSQPQQFYRGSAVETPDKVEETKKKSMPQRMYRGVPILAS